MQAQHASNARPAGGLPSVTVIIPSYNHERYVREAVESVWNQTYRAVELVVLDDGSRDGSPALLRELHERSPVPMQLVLKENEGICRTANRGIELATGDYICFLASDDRYPPTRIAEHMQVLRDVHDPRIAGCCGSLDQMDESGNPLQRTKALPQDHPDQFRAELQRKTAFSLQGATFRAEVVRELRFDPDLFFEDWDFYIRLTRRYRMLPVDVVSCVYRVTPGSASSQVAKMIRARAQLLDKFARDDEFPPDALRILRAEILLANSKSEYNSARYFAAFAWLTRALARSPRLLLHEARYIGSLCKRAVLLRRAST
jgi:alpha-1,3-rhamnosyltransferase